MAAYAAVVSLMNNIEQIVSHPRLSTSLDNKYIKPLGEKAGFLLDFIEGCHNHGRGSKEVAEELERRITSAAHAAEDVIESHIMDQIHAGTSEVSLRCSLDLQQIIQDIDAIMTKATEEKRGWRKQEKSTHTAEPLIESGETSMVGLDDELSKLLLEVTWDQSSRRIISIIGMGGTGKTTLATNIYQHAFVKQHFEIRAWTTISQQYNAEEILSKLLSCIGKSTSGTVDALGEELHKTLCGRKYLIVLDDIWSVEAWDKVRRFFPDVNGSRVVLTTRLSNVATDCGSSYDLKMDLLDVDKSWKLFCDKASFFPQKDDPSHLEDVGKEIVESCKGLALSISVIGGLLLKSPRTVEYWKGVAKNIKSIRDSKVKQESLDVLCLSYSHLPPHLKPCFLYMGVFKEDSEIRVSNLIKLWIGEGFLKPNGSREIEEVAEGYINDLIDRNLILVGRRRSNGKIRFCGIHDLLRDLTLKIAKEQKFYVGSSFRIGEERRLKTLNSRYCPDDEKLYSLHVYLRYLHHTPSWNSNFVLPSSVLLIWNLQTLIIIRYGQLLVAPSEIWKMRQLRHLECETIYLPNPPVDEGLMLEKLQTLKTTVNLGLSEEVCNIIPNIKKLHLKYDYYGRGYDESYIKRLCSLNRFRKLETLKLICGIRTGYELNKIIKFPSSLKKLSLEGCNLGWEDMTKIGSLPRLEVLNLDTYSVSKGGGEWRPINEQFLRLKFLKISGCILIEWNADSSHFPALEKLLLRLLHELKEIPLDIGEVPTLQHILVEHCSEDAAISAIKIKENRLDSNDKDGLQIQIIMYDSRLKIFEERLEREELTTNNIQLKTYKSS